MFIIATGKDAQDKPNRLPVPESHFYVGLRIYWPEQAILDGKWKPAAIMKI